MGQMKTLCFDLDGVICSQTAGDYGNAAFDKDAISLINRLYAEGFRIVIHTSRFMGRNKGDALAAQKEGHEFTARQLKEHDVKFHELILGKPRYDLLVDDRAVFFKRDWRRIEEEIRCLKG